MSAPFGSSSRRSYPQQTPSLIAPTVVVSITTHARRRDRVSITIEDMDGVRRVLVLRDEDVVRAVVREGDELDDAQAAAVVEMAGRCVAFDRAAAALAVRARSIRELQRWLQQRGIEQAHATDAVNRLTNLGLLDDARFANDFVRSRVEGRGASVWTLRRDLARKGVDRALSDAAIASVLEEAGTDDLAMARRAAERKWRTLSRVEEQTARRRLIAFLRRRGFSGGVAMDVTRELLRERGGIA